MFENVTLIIIIASAVVFIGLIAWLVSLYKKVPQGKALVITGARGIRVSFEGAVVIPVLERLEIMDTSIKKVEIERIGKDGLICKDNMRADIKVAFFVRVNPEPADVKRVAQTIGCERASDITTLNTLFEAKFSEALKTVGKKFDFIQLYDSRAEFKTEILGIIGKDLNGYVLDDCAIDYLEQTPLQFLKADNILDSEGIRKITELTANQNILANQIRRDEEKTITEQNVEAKEAILEFNRQLAEKEERQRREVANITAREQAEIDKVEQEERLRSERAKITTEEEIGIAEANKDRQIIVAQKSKERTEAVEAERVEKDRLLEVNEKERIVTLAQIEKEKAIEEEKKQIQDIVSERVAVDKKVAEEEEKIKDLKALSEAERKKQVALKGAEQEGESLIITTTKRAEADKLAAEVNAEKKMIDAKAQKDAAVKEAEARKIHAEAKAAEEATIGLAEAQVIEAKAGAKERDGSVEAVVLEKRMIAEAKGIEAKAEAERKRGLAQAEVIKAQGTAEAEIEEQKGLIEADVMEKKALADAKGLRELGEAEANTIQLKALADAKGVEEKALAMQKLNDVGKEHEEFKLRLEKEKAIDLAQINVQTEIAKAQASVLAEALKSANIEIIGGEQKFFDSIMGAINQGKTVDRLMNNSSNLQEMKGALLGDGSEPLMDRIKGLVEKSGMSSDDVRNLTMSNLLFQLSQKASGEDKNIISSIMSTVSSLGLGNKDAGGLL
ncbi:MAG: flotillin family protein [Saprospiraceae bacterium]